jgi:hypothetical protein
MAGGTSTKSTSFYVEAEKGGLCALLGSNFHVALYVPSKTIKRGALTPLSISTRSPILAELARSPTSQSTLNGYQEVLMALSLTIIEQTREKITSLTSSW